MKRFRKCTKKAININFITTTYKIWNMVLYIVSSFILKRYVFISKHRHLSRLTPVARHWEYRPNKR